MNKNLFKHAAAALTCAAAVSSQAATMTLSSWTYGNGNTVHVSTPSFNGRAGSFSGTLSGAGAAFDGIIETYCVELTQGFGFNNAYTNYNVVSAASYFGAAKAAALGKLLSYANPLVAGAADGTDDNWSTSLQLAIWNTVYDIDSTLSSGPFVDTTGFAAQANAFLGGALTTTSTLELYVLQSVTNQPQGSTGHQDQLIWRARPQEQQEVPEPASLALALAGLAGLGWSRRRQRSAD